MSSFEYEEHELCLAIEELDIEKIQGMHLDNPELINNSYRAKELLLSLAADQQEKKVVQLFVGFLKVVKFGEHDRLEEYFEKVLYNCDIWMAEFLLNNGAKVAVQKWKDSVWNQIFSDKEILSLLLKNGLDTKFHNKLGQNLLHIFFNYINVKFQDPMEIVEILLNAGVPFDEPDNNGYSPLHSAILSEHIELISYLIKKGADVNKKTIIGQFFPLYLAARRDNTDLIDLLLSNGAEINAKTIIGVTALHVACDNNCKQSIYFLIHKGADVSVEDNNGRTPFSILVSKRFWESNGSKIIIKEIARQKFFGSCSVSKVDTDLINTRYEWKNYLNNCIKELSRMARIKFYPPYSYISVLNMSNNLKKLANLTKNKEFVKEFKANSSFPRYKNELMRIFREAIALRDRSEATYSRLIYIFNNFLPDTVIRKLLENLTVEDLPMN